jgi:phosphate starvation-inducible protein PhoH
MKVIYDESLVSETRGQGYVKCLTHTYLRGTNFENKVVILDETQNYNFGDLKKALTRINDNCKVIVIGHTLQKDTYDTTDAFERYIRYYESMNDSRVAICKLTKNYRGWISQTADELQFV